MGDSVKKATRRGLKAIEDPLRTGASAARREAGVLSGKQQQAEKVRVAEAESEIAEKRQMAGRRVGRQSLIKSSPSGLATTLGG